ncbi:MAG: SEL1-like repeat protein [Clostridia bacterium]|nr:SEL1-like repeat protein [Clostridia bacterium]
MICYKCLKNIPNDAKICPECSIPTAYIPQGMQPNSNDELKDCFIAIAKEKTESSDMYRCFFKGDTMPDWVVTAIKSFGEHLKPDDVLYAVNLAMFGAGKSGLIITGDSFCFKNVGNKAFARFEDISSIYKAVDSPVVHMYYRNGEKMQMSIPEKFTSVVVSCFNLYCLTNSLPIENYFSKKETVLYTKEAPQTETTPDDKSVLCEDGTPCVETAFAERTEEKTEPYNNKLYPTEENIEVPKTPGFFSDMRDALTSGFDSDSSFANDLSDSVENAKNAGIDFGKTAMSKAKKVFESLTSRTEETVIKKTEYLSSEEKRDLIAIASAIEGFEIAGKVKSDIKAAAKNFATGVNINTVLFIVSTSLFGFKTGFIFTDDRMYYYSSGEKRVIFYKDYEDLYPDSDSSKKRYFIKLSSGEEVSFNNYDFSRRAESIKKFIELIREMYTRNNLFENEDSSFINDLTKIVSKYQYRLSESSDNVSIIGNINKDRFNNAKDKYAPNALYEQCLLLADSSFFGSAKKGIMITFWGIYCRGSNDLISVGFFDIDEVITDEKTAIIKLKNETMLVIESALVYENVLGELINEINDFYKRVLSGSVKYETLGDTTDYYSLLSINFETAKTASTVELEEKYKLGNPYAGIELADRYINSGQTRKALKIYENIQHPIALRKLGEIYFSGVFVGRDTQKAESYFKRATELGDLESEVSIANFYFLGINHNIDYKKAFEIYKGTYASVSVDKLPISMLHNLGLCYKYGYGTNIDLAEAEKMFSLSKDKDWSAKYQLAELYTEYPEYEEKSSLGVQYLNELISEGYVQAKTLMGKLLFEGRHVNVDLPQAYALLKDAVNSNDVEAKYQLALAGVYSSGKYLPLNEAFELMKSAAESKHIAATRDVAVMYQFGIGVKKDIFSAKQYYELAASRGDKFSSEWKSYTKGFLNKLRSADYICDPDQQEDDNPFVSLEAKESQTSDNGLDSFVFSYGDQALIKAYDYGNVYAKRKLTTAEDLLKKSSSAGITTLVAEKQFSNFPLFFKSKGHGEAMEYAAHIDDLLHYKHARWVGRSQTEGGADRTVGLFNQTQIQSKCFESSNQGIRNFLDQVCPNGQDKYPGMIFEVNDDLYNNPNFKIEVDKRFGEGTFDARCKSSGYTHEQCLNIKKFGTFDSIKVDIKAGHVAARGAFALSFAISFGVSVINGADPTDALKQSVNMGIKTYGTVLTQSVITAQFLKTAIGKGFITNQRDVISHLAQNDGVKNVLEKATGSTSMTTKNASKIMKTTIVSNVVLTAIMSAPDMLRVIEGRESSRQLVVNTATNASSIAAGSVGYYIGAACGSVVPVVGTFVGGLIGASIAGSVAGKVTRGILTEVLGDDEKEMLSIFNNALVSVAEDYLLSEDELNYVVDELQSGTVLTQNGLRDIYAADDRKEYCVGKIRPVVEEVCELRTFVVMPKEEDYIATLGEALEETAIE